jgi:hypothetical protein
MRNSERGMAMVGVMLMMFLMCALSTGFALSGRTELAISTNHAEDTQTRATAEAGLNQATVLLLKSASISNLGAVLAGPDGEVNTADPSAAVNDDNGSMAFLFGSEGPWTLADGYTFTVSLIDDDDPSLFENGASGSDLASLGEDGSAVADVNRRFIIRAVGFGPHGTTAGAETMLLPDATLPAIVTNSSLTLSGTARVLGTAGGIHSNKDLTIANKNVFVAKDATAAGTYTKPTGWTPGGTGTGSAAQSKVPPVSAADYLEEADLILTSTGLIKNRATNATVCNASSNKNACKTSYGWTFVSTAGGWNLNHSSGTNATVYVEGPATISGSPGSNASPIRLSVIATGSITISGSPKIAPEAASGLLFVTNDDLKISGSISQPQSAEGRVVVRGQLQITASAALKAQILVEDAPGTSNLVTANSIGSSSTITYNGTLASLTYMAAGWRER